MSQEFMNIIETCVIAPMLVALSSFVIAFLHKQTTKIQERINDDKIKRMIEIADGIVEQAVTTVSQTYVDGLKADGAFTRDKQAIAFEKSKETIYKLMTTDVKDAIKENYGDFDEWIKTKIEESINKNK